MLKTTLFSLLNYHRETYHLINSATCEQDKTPGQPSESFSEYIAWVISKCF